MITRQATRQFFSAILFCASVSSLGLLWLKPQQALKTTGTRIRYPQHVSLPTWQPLLRENLPDEGPLEDSSVAYHYQRKDNVLQSEVRYIRGGMDANHFLWVRKRLSPVVEARHDPKRGHYGVFRHDDSYYLIACVPSEDHSTITTEQFNNYRYGKFLSPQHWWQWFRGEVSLREKYCYWVLLILSQNSITGSDDKGSDMTDIDFSTLEAIWIKWFDYWQANHHNFIVAD